MDHNWETIDVPRGAFMGWNDRPGQHATGVVLAYAPQGGKDFDQQPCPALTLELIEEAYSHSKKQGWQKIPAGELVQLNCGQTSLKKAVMASGCEPGDLIKITLDEILWGQGQNGGDTKVFGIKIIRGYRRSGNGSPAQAPAFAGPPPQQQPQFAQQGPPQQQPQFAGPPQQSLQPQWGGPPQQQQPAFATPGPGQQGGPQPQFASAEDSPPF